MGHFGSSHFGSSYFDPSSWFKDGMKGTQSMAGDAPGSSPNPECLSTFPGADLQTEHISAVIESLESRINKDPEGFIGDLDRRMQSLLGEAALAEPLNEIRKAFDNSVGKQKDVPPAESACLQSMAEVCAMLETGKSTEPPEEERRKAQQMLVGMLDHGPFPQDVFAQLAPKGSEDPHLDKLVHYASTDSDLTRAAAALNW